MIKKELYIDSILGGLILFLFIGFASYSTPFWEAWDRILFDLGTRISFRTKDADQSKPVVIEIDDRSLYQFGPWPWPHQTIAGMIDKLHGYGAKVIGLNVPLPDYAIPQGLKEIKELKEKFIIHPAAKEAENFIPWITEDLDRIIDKLDARQKLAQSLKNSGNIILAVYEKDSRPPSSIQNAEESFLNDNLIIRSRLTSSIRYIRRVERLELPFTEIMQQAAGVGLGDFAFGRRGVRSHPLFFRYRNSFLPSLPLRMVAAYIDQQPSQMIIEEDRIRIGNLVLPIYRGELLIKSLHSQKAPQVHSVADLLDDKIETNFLKDQVVLVGLNASGMRPFRHSPEGEINVNQWLAGRVADMLNQKVIRRPVFWAYLELGILILLSFAVVFFFSRWNSLQRLAGMLGISFVLIATGLVLSAFGQIWTRTSLWIGYVITVYAAISISRLFTVYSGSAETVETNRLLALSLQSQGHLDQAFEKFKKLPLDSETKELLYKLGLEYEQKRMTEKALDVYEYIDDQGQFKDLAVRIARLNESEGSSTIGSHGGMADVNILRETPLEERSKVGRYKVLAVLGRGSMGLVYKALDPKINRLLAIKTIRFSDEFEEEVIHEIKSRFFREAEIAGQLSHPAIVTIFDVGEDGDLTYMAMEFLEGNDLTKFISKGSLLPFRKVLDVAANVADALDYAHKTDVIHRDIKPANIMLLKNGGVKVTDFGIAKAISSSRTRTGVILGTPNYMSPEQIMGQKIDSRSDIFSLGVLFYQLLVGRTPFQGESLSNLLYQITQLKHPAMQTFNPKIPAVCEKIVDRALAKNPADRFQNAAEFAKYVRLLAGKIDQMKKTEAVKNKD